MFRRLRNTLSNITPYIFSRENSWRLGGSCVLFAAGMGLEVFAPYVMGEIYGMLSAEAATTTIFGIEMPQYALMATGAAAYLMRGFVISRRNKLLAPLAPYATKKLLTRYAEEAVFRKLETQRQTTDGEDLLLIQKAYSAMGNIPGILTTQIFPTLLDSAFTAGMISWWYSAEFGLVLLGSVGFSAAYNISATKINLQLRNETLEAGNVCFDDLMRTVEHARTIQSNNKEAEEIQRVADSHQTWAEVETKSSEHIFAVSENQEIIALLFFTAIIFLGGYRALSKELTAADYATLITLMIQFFAPITTFGTASSELVSALGDMEKIFEFLDSSSRIADPYPDRELKLSGNNAEIEFKNVSFHYENAQMQALDKVSFIAPAGKKTVIVGASGSGKSTTASLIFREYDPQEGTIYIDGQNTKEFGLKKVRSMMSFIHQKSTLFFGTIEENIAYGVPDATHEQVVEAAKKACLAEFIESLPDKYQTNVGRNGENVSGGQAQRIAIARALIRNPKILLCDEATSALDSETQANIQREIDAIPNVTKVMITHQLSVAKNADLIVVLKKGKLVESGTHDSLLAKEGDYANLWHTQNPTLKLAEEKNYAVNDMLHDHARQADKSGLCSIKIHSMPSMFFHHSPEAAYSDVVVQINEALGRGKSPSSAI